MIWKDYIDNDTHCQGGGGGPGKYLVDRQRSGELDNWHSSCGSTVGTGSEPAPTMPAAPFANPLSQPTRMLPTRVPRAYRPDATGRENGRPPFRGCRGGFRTRPYRGCPRAASGRPARRPRSPVPGVPRASKRRRTPPCPAAGGRRTPGPGRRQKSRGRAVLDVPHRRRSTR